MSEISIIVPVYKAERYLDECVNSILSQTFLDFELILVDDGSPDRCGEICDAYARSDSRIKVIHQKNQGQSAARNAAIKMAKGNWICFVDSDDAIHPQMLESLYDAAVSNNVQMSMCSFVEAELIPEGFYRSHDVLSSVVTLDEDTLLRLYDKNQYPSWVVWGKLIRREIVQKLLFAEGRVYEDNAIVCQWVYEAKNAATVDEALYFYRINLEGTTKTRFNIKKLDYLWALEEIIAFFEKVEYKNLCSLFCQLYVETSESFYIQTINELKDQQRANQIRRQLYRMITKYWRYMTRSKANCIRICSIQFPKLMRLCFNVKSALKNFIK